MMIVMGIAIVTKRVTRYSYRSLDNPVLAVDITAKVVYSIYITNKIECFNFKKSMHGNVTWVAKH